MRRTRSEPYDLNLMLAFEAVMHERNVTAAAHELGLSQPTLSHALNRLRKMCNDPLFVRTPAGMQPTAYALSIRAPISEALGQIRRALERRETFDPRSEDRLFRLLLTDMGSVTFLPPLIRHLQNHAPRVRLEIRQLPQGEYKEALQSGEVNLAIGQMPAIVAGFYQQKIFEDVYVCAARADHPRLMGGLSLQQYLTERHVRVLLPGRPLSPVDEAMADLGLARTVMLDVPQYLALPPILGCSELIATVPHNVFQVMSRSEHLQMWPLPYAMPKSVVRQFWHERNHAEPGLVWLRATISRLFADSNGGGAPGVSRIG